MDDWQDFYESEKARGRSVGDVLFLYKKNTEDWYEEWRKAETAGRVGGISIGDESAELDPHSDF